MGKINGCIKCLFIFFNVVFAILGCVLFYLAVQITAFSHQVAALGGPSLAWSWVFALGVLILPVLGIVAACMEKELVLRIFAGFMVAGMIIMLIFGIVVVVSRNTMNDSFDTVSAELAKPIMEAKETRNMLMAFEQSLQCCGVVSSSDWGMNIPQSCECKMQDKRSLFSSRCKANVGLFGPDQIYATSCSSALFVIANFIFKIVMGICFTFAILALLALLMSVLMIHQIRKHDGGESSMAMQSY
ncbi:tetraspanin-8-like isoform X1 [Pseudochaenichthys georgianus]|uniref:tetraspanin-8-like isoform X1 n=1 Tax=Pseudochaenichthys georgianus TaxID=52239 RepID=UPI00146A54E4|nr:tetraspanin-8-like isoform X1 [Pseudochaenichthys georgianus]